MTNSHLQVRVKNKIAARSRNVNIIQLVLILILIMVFASIMGSGITRDASLNLARFYSIEAVDILNNFINQDLILVRKVAHSRALTEWFADPGNQEKRTAAYYEMMDYVNLLPDSELFFGINDTLTGLAVNAKTGLDDFVPTDYMDSGDPDYSWYYDCIKSVNDYSLNIDINKNFGQLYFWINHKVMYNGSLTGVVTSGLKISDVLSGMFKNYDAQKVRGYVINKQGVIQMDSLNNFFIGDTEKSYIRDSSPDPSFVGYMDSYLDNIDGVFNSGSKPQVISLAKGPYRFVSIAPVSSTDWSVVIFFNSNSLFSFTRLLPLCLVMIALFLLYTLADTLMMYQFVFIPLNYLTVSLSEVQSDNGVIFGSDRDDEIGVLSRTITGMRDRLNAYNSELVYANSERDRLDRLLRAVNQAAAVLLSTVDEAGFESSLQEGMELMAGIMDADRVYIWKNEIRNGVLYYVQQYDWMNDLGRNSNPVPGKAAYPYSDNPDWESAFIKNECVNGPLSQMSEHTRELLRPCMVQSLLLIPVHLHDHFWGFVNFDDCHSERHFTEEEINILRSASLMIVSAVNRNIQAAEIREANDRLQLMLDATPLCCNLWNHNLQNMLCNEAAVRLFNLGSKQEYLDSYNKLSPEYQPDGALSSEKAAVYLKKAFNEGRCVYEWMHQMPDGTRIPSEVTLVRVSYGNEFIVAGYTRDLREYRHMMNGIEQRDMMLQTVNQAATILLQSEIDNFDDDLLRSISMMAKAVNSDRVQIWKNHIKDGNNYYSQIYKWPGSGISAADGISALSEFDEQNTGNPVLYEYLPGWVEKLTSGECINSSVADLSEEAKNLFITRGVVSILAIPVILQDQFWGFVCFDDCRNVRVFSENEESILRSGCLLTATALLRNEMTLNLHTTAARLAAVISNYSGIIWSVDRDYIITLFNGLYLSKIGVEPDFLEGKSLYTAKFKNRHLDIIKYIEKTFAEGPQDWFSEIDGNVYRARSIPMYDEKGNIAGVVGSIDDITDMIELQTALENALEKAQAASQAKSNFLSNMSHEIRTPMNAIIGMTKIGKSASDLEKKDYAFEKIDGASGHLLGVINDVLEMSKIESGKFALSSVEFNFEKMLQKTVDVISFRIDEKKQNFSVFMDRNIPQNLTGDDQRLVQVITNLLSNSVKFTPNEGSIRLAAYLENMDGNYCTVKISLTDTGIGISAEQQARLFNSFEQAETSTTRKFGGTGLGLSISKHIVELMDGKIWVESELGKGATFLFTFRMKSAAKHPVSPLHPGIDWHSVSILAADSDPVICDSFKYIAQSFDIKCDTASDGQVTLDLIESGKHYDILFIDRYIPNSDSYRITGKFREVSHGSPVIIMVSAAEWNVIEQKAKDSGINDYITKPLFPSSVAGCLNRFVGLAVHDESVKKSAEQKESFAGYRILLAEDVEINREIVCTMLEEMQLVIDCAVNGIEAADMFAQRPDSYDLILMDLQMPEMDGFEATRRIRAMEHPAAKTIPIIAMTANVFREDIEKCLKSGMNEHIGKPIDFDEVTNKLRVFLKSGNSEINQ